MRVWITAAALALATPLTAAASPSWSVTALNDGLTAYAASQYGAARAQFVALSNHGSAIAETMLGIMYARGQGVHSDPATAATYWFRAASRGYAPAQLALARALANGRGVTRDYGAAWVWAQLAAARGDAPLRAQAHLLAASLETLIPPADRARLTRRVEGWQPWPG